MRSNSTSATACQKPKDNRRGRGGHRGKKRNKNSWSSSDLSVLGGYLFLVRHRLAGGHHLRKFLTEVRIFPELCEFLILQRLSYA